MTHWNSKNMATSEVSYNNEDNDIKTCTICLEQFNIPKYLPCLHFFCESCIGIYISSAFEKENTCINCPVCRSKLPSPELGITPEQWARQLPLNYLLVGLIEKHKVERPEKICMSCERFDANKKSEANSVCIDCSDTLCYTCVNYHRINKSSSNHEIVEISRQDIILKSFKNMCTEHKSKDIELFCVDHDLPCCATCVSVNHRKCENVLTIEDAAKKFRETTSVNELKNNVIILLADLDIVLDSENMSFEKLKADNISQLKAYHDFWTKVQQQIDEMKKKQTKQYQKIIDAEKAKFESSITNLENKKKTVTNTKQILEVTENEASDVQVMIEFRKVNEQIDQHKLGLKRERIIREIFFQFKQNTDEIDEMLEKVCSINCNSETDKLDLESFKDENGYLEHTFHTLKGFDNEDGKCDLHYLPDLAEDISNEHCSLIPTYPFEVLSRPGLTYDPFDDHCSEKPMVPSFDELCSLTPADNQFDDLCFEEQRISPIDEHCSEELVVSSFDDLCSLTPTDNQFDEHCFEEPMTGPIDKYSSEELAISSFDEHCSLTPTDNQFDEHCFEEPMTGPIDKYSSEELAISSFDEHCSLTPTDNQFDEHCFEEPMTGPIDKYSSEELAISSFDEHCSLTPTDNQFDEHCFEVIND